MLGFLYRAVVGTAMHVCRGRKSLRALGANWLAALKLPFVYLGMARDLWRGFDRYVEIEAGLASTYFVIPTRNDPGQPFAGNGISRRAVRYDVTDVQAQLQRVISAGCEVGLHGIDTWVDSRKGIEERERVTRTIGTSVNGVRMHWLFFDEKSPAVLEQAGFAYDSTIGYRETVGYRAGTMQAYKPLTTRNLLELPLHVMDTALFFPKYLNLSDAEAERVVGRLIDDAAEFGGALTINWHDRSIAPERLWDSFYLKLLRELKSRGAWFATADQAISWFKKRRSAVVRTSGAESGKIRVQASVESGDKLPALRVRVHSPGTCRRAGATPAKSSPAFEDVVLQDRVDTEIDF
jgi:peptidoglycan/xylan/chitin deacetylase (PgdA/CDA1 family)